MSVKAIDALFVSGPDLDGDYSIELGDEYTYLTRAQADALIAALQDPVRDASGRIVAPAQSEPAPRPDGPWNDNTKGRP